MEISQLDRISYSILLQETLELRQVLQSIVNSQDTIDIMTSLFPFYLLCLLCVSVGVIYLRKKV